jgi:chromosome segregation ATPase
MKLPLALSPWHSRQIIDHDGYFVAECRNTVDRKPIVEAVNDHADLRGDLRSLSAAINRLEDASEERGRREAELFNTVEDLAQRKHELEAELARMEGRQMQLVSERDEAEERLERACNLVKDLMYLCEHAEAKQYVGGPELIEEAKEFLDEVHNVKEAP